MSDLDTTGRSNRRASRPERINLGDDEGVRNDIVAAEQGCSERTLNRGDAEGAPYLYVGGVKYRPIKAYRAYLAGTVQVRNQKRKRSGRAA